MTEGWPLCFSVSFNLITIKLNAYAPPALGSLDGSPPSSSPRTSTSMSSNGCTRCTILGKCSNFLIVLWFHFYVFWKGVLSLVSVTSYAKLYQPNCFFYALWFTADNTRWQKEAAIGLFKKILSKKSNLVMNSDKFHLQLRLRITRLRITSICYKDSFSSVYFFSLFVFDV